MTAHTPLDLDTRLGWPADLRVLLDRYPREVWPAHPNLGATARFWIAKHDMFRELGGALQGATKALREGEVAAGPFRGWFAPRLRLFLGELEGHHQIEDHAYFPLFRAADARLVRGFDVLEGDHEAIHHALEVTAERARALLVAPETDQDALRRAADAYADQADRLLASLLRHLDDEEDLIIPMILDRTEGGLGI
ncbi:hemerythrin domain-containing protein [Salinarimonas chemoclinalis]|uniref:hemerythrin domain-containing protein n=1 Tax=Salinarimonas chemoclinalis TaxID=3241599 RepID=UPI0035566499